MEKPSLRGAVILSLRQQFTKELLGGLEYSMSLVFFFFSSRRRHTRFDCDWSSDVCSSDLTAMMFHLGGEDRVTGAWSGIHAHASTRFQIRYEVLDNHRDTIGRIQKLDGNKVVKEWLPPKTDAAVAKETRVMDCTDCHNRATHIYDESPEAAVTRALVEGRLDRKIPWLYAVSANVLASATPPRDGAKEYFRQALETSYTRSHAAQKPPARALGQNADAL